jgi:short-subunit dehydrogenase
VIMNDVEDEEEKITMACTALITGASSGIGYELAKLFAGDGYDLILVARQDQPLRRAAAQLKQRFSSAVNVIVKDLSHPGSAKALYSEVTSSGYTVDVLVNNAGVGYGGAFHNNSLDEEVDVLQLNVMSLMRLTHLFAGDFAARGSGKILNVASLAAFQPGPYLANYYASKAYVLAFSEALAHELRECNITVTTLCPGTTKTEFHRKGRLEGTGLSRGLFDIVMDPAAVALAGYRGLKRGKTVVVPGTLNKLAALSVRVAPRRAVTWCTALINRPRERTVEPVSG